MGSKLRFLSNAFLVLIMLTSFLLQQPAQSLASGNNIITKEEFLKLVKKDKFFLEHQYSFIDSEPIAFKDATNEDGNKIGYLLQFEIEYNNKTATKEEGVVLNYSSLLTFIYLFDTGVLETILVDYSQLSDTGDIKVIDLNKTNEQVIVKKDELNER